MRIAQIVESIDVHRGGRERYVNELIQELVKLGHEVTLFCCDRNLAKGNFPFEVRYFNCRSFFGLQIPFNSVRLLNQKFDVCHLHYHALFGDITAFASRINKQKLVTTIHDEGKRGVHKALYDRTQWRMVSHFSTKIVCMSRGMRDALIRRGLNKDKTVIIPNAMHVEKIKKQANELRSIDNYSRYPIDLLFVGRLEERKGVQYLLKALSILKTENLEPNLHVVGEGPYKQKLVSLAEETGLQSQVHFTGYLSSQELAKTYLKARIVAIPSLYEGTPNRVAIEALAMGKRIIATSTPGMEAIRANGVSLMVPPRNSQMLAAAIQEELGRSPKDALASQIKLKNFAEQFDWSNSIKKIISLYANLAYE